MQTRSFDIPANHIENQQYKTSEVLFSHFLFGTPNLDYFFLICELGMKNRARGPGFRHLSPAGKVESQGFEHMRNLRKPEQITDGDYSIRILHGEYSNRLKIDMKVLIDRFRAFDEAGSPAIPYISAWGEGLRVRVRASFGVSTFPDDATSLSEPLALADQAMSLVKERGKKS